MNHYNEKYLRTLVVSGQNQLRGQMKREKRVSTKSEKSCGKDIKYNYIRNLRLELERLTNIILQKKEIGQDQVVNNFLKCQSSSIK